MNERASFPSGRFSTHLNILSPEFFLLDPPTHKIYVEMIFQDEPSIIFKSIRTRDLPSNNPLDLEITLNLTNGPFLLVAVAVHN